MRLYEWLEKKDSKLFSQADDFTGKYHNSCVLLSLIFFCGVSAFLGVPVAWFSLLYWQPDNILLLVLNLLVVLASRRIVLQSLCLIECSMSRLARL